MDDYYDSLLGLISEFKQFSSDLFSYLAKRVQVSFLKFEAGKGIFVSTLYRQRGKMAKRFVHTGMAGIAALGVMIAPVIAEEFPGENIDPWEIPQSENVLSLDSSDAKTETLVSEKMRDKAIEYTVAEGDTVGSIAKKFDVSEDTIRWQNDLKSKDSIKVGQVLEILPITGISHKVLKGDTVFSLAKKYDTSAQAIVDFPYNTFMNDETFELAVGQTIVIPDGVKQEAVLWSPTARVRQITPDAGTVVASGSFVWPTSGSITQRFAWYHKGLDIANSAGPDVLAADAGTVRTAGWLDGYGYGNRVVIDHGNGFTTLYAHLSSIYVVPGQTVGRGARIGRMGSTGRSTGTHLHFEVISNGTYLNPLNVLQ